MSIQDLHDLTPLPQVDPLTLGVSPAPMAPPPLPPAPQMGQPVQANPSQRILSLAALASMIAGGRATSGLGSGILQGQQRMEDERQQREAVQMNERRYQEQQAQQQQIQFQREQAQWQQTLQARQQTLMKAVGDIRQQVSKLPNKGAYDQQIEGFANLLRSSGYRVDSNWLRQAAPYMEPSAQDRASKALDEVLANPMTQAAMKADPSRVMGGKVMFDANGDGTPEAVSFQELAAMAGRPMVSDEQGNPLIPTAEEGKPGTPFQEILKASLNRFRAENRRDPNPKEKQGIVESAMLQSKEKPDAGLTGLASEMAAARLELLRAQTDKAKQDALAAEAKNAPPQESPYSQERAQRILQSVDRLMTKVNRWTTGAGSMLSGIPATDARNFAAELNTLKSNIAYNELAEMRAASKTGGALGAVSDRETTLLESALGALDTGQSPENFRQQLQQIRDSLQRWEDAKRGGTAPAAKPAGRTYGKYTFRVK